MGELFSVLGSNIPALLCLLIGYALVVLEMCIPGFGVPGILGIVLIFVGVITGTPTVTSALILGAIMVVLVIVALPICVRFIGKGRFSKSRIVLNDVSVAERGAVHEFDRYLGASGQALTTLRPAGMGLFDGERLSVVSDGEYIGEGTSIVAIRVDGNRIVVREAGAQESPPATKDKKK